MSLYSRRLARWVSKRPVNACQLCKESCLIIYVSYYFWTSSFQIPAKPVVQSPIKLPRTGENFYFIFVAFQQGVPFVLFVLQF